MRARDAIELKAVDVLLSAVAAPKQPKKSRRKATARKGR
jgi:hypothetical protein